MRRAWHSQQWVALEVPCKSVRRVCSYSGVGLATAEGRAGQVRGIYHLPLGIYLVFAVAGCLPFCHPLLDPHKSWRRNPASQCSAAAALKPLSQASVGSVEAGPWTMALAERQRRSMGMQCRRRSTWGNKKHHWAWFYSTRCEGHVGYC